MLAHKKFGLPLPLLENNPFRITAVNLYKDGISIPEGCLRFVDKKFIEDWMKKLEQWLAENYPGVGYKIYKDVSEIPLYKIEIDNTNRKNAIAFSEFDKIAPRLTLKRLCEMAYREENCSDFFKLLEEQLPEVEYNYYKKLVMEEDNIDED